MIKFELIHQYPNDVFCKHCNTGFKIYLKDITETPEEEHTVICPACGENIVFKLKIRYNLV